MFAPNESSTGLSKIIKFNRYLSLTLLLNLIIYTFQINPQKDGATDILIAACWLSILVFALMNEVTRKIIKKSIIATPEVCSALTQFNIAFTAILITTITLCTGNTNFMVLYLIPIFESLFFSKINFSKVIISIGIIVLFGAELSGWLKNSILIANKDIYMPVAFTLTTILGLLSYSGFLFSGYVKDNTEKTDLLHNMATTDALTGLTNRREFNKRISEEISRAKRHKSALTLALFDIDLFKRINDTYGHNVGDQILRELGELISVNTRDCDISARYGGEEFALILPETTQSEAYELLERLRLMVEVHYFYLSSVPIKATISVGVAQYDLIDESTEDLCEKADKALYQAKRKGRNRVECATFSLPKLDLSRVLVNN